MLDCIYYKLVNYHKITNFWLENIKILSLCKQHCYYMDIIST